jgi:cyclic pyranopterin phosphate synthase
MNEKTSFLPRAQLLTLEELALVGRAFVELGVTKIRLTGGEPLVRNNVLKLFQTLGQLEGLKELTLTTNGVQLTKMASALRSAGVKRVNISLDTLKPTRFQEISRIGKLDSVLKGIEAAIAAQFERVKLNAVILKHRNHDEVIDLTQFAVDRGIDISFIEEMPVGLMSERDRQEAFYASDQIRRDLEQLFTLIPTTESTGGPAKYYQIANTHSRVGFIAPHTHNFCDHCNRVRVTTEGLLVLCLGQENALNLRKIIRAHPGNITRLKQAIVQAVQMKPKGHDFTLSEQPYVLRHMNVTGG